MKLRASKSFDYTQNLPALFLLMRIEAVT